MSETQTRIFICPFNQYHKLMEYRKWSFHITRCGDRKGKTVYSCQYQSSHYFTDISSLMEHEAECEFRKTQKTRFDNADPEVAKSRPPIAVYCKYDVGHVFQNIDDCNDHMKECPKREEFMKKAEQCHRKFSENKSWIKAAQQAKKEKECELGGNINAPASQKMPNLRYQYVMNEPFIGGIKQTVCSSLEANVHKRRVAYDLDIEEERQELAMTINQQKERMNRELVSKIDNDIEQTGQAISTSDVDVLQLKSDNKVEYGLRISQRKFQKLSLFDFNIEKQISVSQFINQTNIDVQNPKEIVNFLEKNYLLKLNVFQPEEENPEDYNKQAWRERALEILDEHQVQLQLGESSSVQSILFNSIQGRKLNVGIQNNLETHNVFLFVISKETEYFGRVLKSEFKCDFILVKHEAPFADGIKVETGETIDQPMTDLEILAKAREATGFGGPKEQQMQIKTDGASILADQHIQLLKDDKFDLEQQMKDLNEEIKRLNVELETANKSIWDKERAIKQDKREIDHQDNVLRTNKTKLQEVFEQLNVKELNLKNSEKEIDNLRADIKKNELRFEQQKQRTDNFQNKYNESSLKLQKAQDFLGSANKIVRHKQNLLQQSEARVKELEKILNDHFQGKAIAPQGMINLGDANKKANFILEGAKAKEEPEPVQIESSTQERTADPISEFEDEIGNLVDEAGVEDAEIVDDEDPDHDNIQKLKAQFQLNQLKRKQNEKKANPKGSGASGTEPDEFFDFDQTALEETKIDVENEGLEKLKERLLCVSCLEKPKCMVIQSCKHVPFCSGCEKSWRDQASRTDKPLECPICRKEYNKTQMIQIWQ